MACCIKARGSESYDGLPRHLILDQSGHKHSAPTPEVLVRQSRFPSGRPPFSGRQSRRWSISGLILCSCPRSAFTAGGTGQLLETRALSPVVSYQLSGDRFKSRWHIRLIGRGGVTLHWNLGWARGRRIPVRESAASGQSMQAGWRPLSCRRPEDDPLGRHRQLAPSVRIHNTALPFQRQNCRLLHI